MPELLELLKLPRQQLKESPPLLRINWKLSKDGRPSQGRKRQLLRMILIVLENSLLIWLARLPQLLV